jgi:hypothetical protein
VPLEAADIMPGTVFRHLHDQPDVAFWTLCRVEKTGIVLSDSLFTWEELAKGDWEYALDTKNWKPCSKEYTKK